MADDDDIRTRMEQKIAAEAARLTVKTAWAGLKATVGGITDDFLGFAEKELESAKAVRGQRDPLPLPVEPLPTEPPPSEAHRADAPVNQPPAPAPGTPEPLPPTPMDLAKAHAVLREARARDELAALKAQRATGGAAPPHGQITEPSKSVGPPPAPDPEQALRAQYPAYAARLDREEKARRDLEALKALRARGPAAPSADPGDPSTTTTWPDGESGVKKTF